MRFVVDEHDLIVACVLGQPEFLRTQPHAIAAFPSPTTAPTIPLLAFMACVGHLLCS
jgi:hypothetical protein